MELSGAVDGLCSCVSREILLRGLQGPRLAQAPMGGCPSFPGHLSAAGSPHQGHRHLIQNHTSSLPGRDSAPRSSGDPRCTRMGFGGTPDGWISLKNGKVEDFRNGKFYVESLWFYYLYFVVSPVTSHRCAGLCRRRTPCVRRHPALPQSCTSRELQ